MAGKENPDLFSHFSPNDGSLPLDFDKNPKVADASKVETSKKMEIPESVSMKTHPIAGKTDSHRHPTHHVPPPYKKIFQEPVIREPKNDVEIKSSIVVQDKPVETTEPEPVKGGEDVKSKDVAIEISPPASADIPTPAEKAEIPVSIPVAATVAVPVEEVISPSVPVIQMPVSQEADKSLKSAAPAVKRNRHPKVTQPAKQPATVEKQVEPVVQVKADLKPQEPDIKQQRISKTESPKSATKTNAMEKSSMGNSTAGQLLQEGRVKVGLSIEQVSISTKIKNTFIESLERDDLDNLPASVYVNAYTRALCSLYNIDDKLVFGLLNKMRGKNLDHPVPEEVIQQLEKGKLVNIVQENKVKRILFIGFAACLVLAACVFITYRLINAGNNSRSSLTAVKPAIKPESPVQQIGMPAKTLQEDMERKLMVPHVFTMTSLPLVER